MLAAPRASGVGPPRWGPLAAPQLGWFGCMGVPPSSSLSVFGVEEGEERDPGAAPRPGTLLLPRRWRRGGGGLP